MTDNKTDERYMAMALDLAEQGRGATSPNPMVGAVIVHNDMVVGKGWHKKAGTPHAEAIALQKAGTAAAGGTLYVNLEPCCHTEKLTPPCSDAIIKAGLARVVVGMVDPNPKVSGKGIQALRDAGIAVEVGVLGERAARLNESFCKWVSVGIPFVTMKVAQTLDGKIATSTGDSKWITGPDARRMGHVLRNQVDAILVGIGTILRDDPSLTTRIEGVENTRDPHRVILDSHLRVPLDAKVLKLESVAKTYIATTIAAPTSKMKELKRRGVEILIVDEVEGRLSMPLLMEELAKMGMTHVLVEGGARVNAEALRSGVVDKAMFFIAPKILGGDDARGSIGWKSPESLDEAIHLTHVHHSRVGDDILIEGYIQGHEAHLEQPPVEERTEDRHPHRKKKKRSRKK